MKRRKFHFSKHKLLLFLNNVPDEVYLIAKDIVIFGITAAYRICEISRILLIDIEVDKE